MANKPMKPCRHAGCAELIRGGGYCDKHRPDELPRRESAAWHYLYNSKVWRRLRAVQLLREPYCRVCRDAGIRTRATAVDHIKPHRGSRERFYDENNLQSLCDSCHSKKTMRERNERKKGHPQA